MKRKMLLVILLLPAMLQAQLRVSSVFSDNMVLQRDKVNRVWGWAAPGQLVTTQFKGKNYPAVANSAGEWMVWLDPAKAGEAGTVTIQADQEKIEFTNILMGEVWICSGQSNMEWRMDMLKDVYQQELNTAKNEQIRFTVISKSLATMPEKEARIQKKWVAVDPATVGECSAVAYWYAKKLQRELNVPIGLVVTAWGGTPAQSWTSVEGLGSFSQYINDYVKNIRPLNLKDIDRQQAALRVKYQETLAAKSAYSKTILDPGFNDQGWKEMSLPKLWEEQGYPSLDGVVVYRLSFDINEAAAGKEAVLNMPAIDDIDSTYINGRFIGSINQWDAIRTYTIPAGVLKAGRNVLVIRVQDDGGGGGLAAVPDKFYIVSGAQKIMLAGKAKYEILAELPDMTGGRGALEHQPAVLFNAMIAPLLPLSIRGVIWYQGESNADTKDESIEYSTLFPSMITDWRNRWGQGDFPFLFVQLASFGPVQKEPAESNWALLREAQTNTLRLPNTGMAITTDIGNPVNIHPVKKQEVGDRLADEAMRFVYGNTKRISGGPVYHSMQVKGAQVIIRFTNTGKGLLAKAGALKQFAIAGTDKKFYWADAIIQGNTVILKAKQVPLPVAARYAWADSPVDANLYNKDGYPAGPFRTDNW